MVGAMVSTWKIWLYLLYINSNRGDRNVDIIFSYSSSAPLIKKSIQTSFGLNLLIVIGTDPV